MKKLAVLFTLLVSSFSFAQLPRPTVYIEAQQGFETYLGAAMTKKNVPADIVTDPAKATYVLKTAPVEIQNDTKKATDAGLDRSTVTPHFLFVDRKRNQTQAGAGH